MGHVFYVSYWKQDPLLHVFFFFLFTPVYTYISEWLPWESTLHGIKPQVVFSTDVVCVKTRQKYCSIKHHDKTKQEYKQLKNMIQSQSFLSVPKHYYPYSANLLGMHQCSHEVPYSQ